MIRPLLVLTLLVALTGCRTESSVDSPEASGDGTSATGSAAGDPEEAALVDAAERDAEFDASVAAGEVDLDTFELTMDRMDRWARASANLLALTEAKPALAKKWREDGADPNSYDEMLERIEAVPEAVRLVERAGLSAAEFIATGVVYLRTTRATQDPASGLGAAPGVTRTNKAFVSEHRARIDSLLAPLAQK